MAQPKIPIAAGASSPVARLPEIDGLRAVACLLVLFLHAVHFGHVGGLGLRTENPALSMIVYLLLYGYGGVDLFFLLSGFCLAYPLLAAPHKPFSWKRYAKARIKRIYPPYLASLLFLLLVGLFVHFNPSPLLQPLAANFGLPTTKELIYSFTLWYVWGNPAYWTLVLEARWYFLFPLITLPFQRIAAETNPALLKHRYLTAAAILLVTSFVSATTFYWLSLQSGWLGKVFSLSTSVLFFMPEFALGILVAFIFSRPDVFDAKLRPMLVKTAVVLLAMGTVLMFFWTENPATPSQSDIVQNLWVWNRLIPFGLMATGLLLLTLYSPPIQRLLSHRYLVQLGTMSYSIYLMHIPIISLCDAYISLYQPSAQARFILFLLPVSALCLIIGALFFFCFEKPLLKRKTVGEKVALASGAGKVVV